MGKTTSWYKEIEEICEELGENINLLISTLDREELRREYSTGKPSGTPKFVAWTARYIFTNVVTQAGEILTYVARNPTVGGL